MLLGAITSENAIRKRCVWLLSSRRLCARNSVNCFHYLFCCTSSLLFRKHWNLFVWWELPFRAWRRRASTETGRFVGLWMCMFLVLGAKEHQDSSVSEFRERWMLSLCWSLLVCSSKESRLSSFRQYVGGQHHSIATIFACSAGFVFGPC